MGKHANEMAYDALPEEKDLVHACVNADARAQKRLFEKYYGKMLGVCLRYTIDREEARDTLQEGFVKVFQKISSFNFNCPLEAWIRRIMVNTAIDKYRKNALTPPAIDIETAYNVSSDDDVVSDMSHEELLCCLINLPTGYRMVFNMYVIEGFSHKEIGEALGITEGTSKSQLAKARIYLQKLLSRKFSTDNARQDG